MANLNDTLGPVIDGRRQRVSDASLGRVLGRDYLFSDWHKNRQQDARVRIDFYRDKGLRHIQDDIAAIFKNAKVRAWRQLFARFALWQNSTKRIIRETSAVYSEAADRTIKRAPERYRELQRQIGYDRTMRKVNRFTNLLNETLVRPDVNPYTGAPELRIETPDRFWAIAHPNDPLTCVGFIVQLHVPAASKPTDPHYLVIDDETFFHLNKAGHVLDRTRTAHGVGRLPGVLVHREQPDDGLLDCYSGQDLISAHRTIAMLIVMLLKHQKSGTKQPYAAGDTSAMATGQPMDEEHLMSVPEGVVLSTLDLGADPEKYIAAIRAVIKAIASNYGIPESVYDLSYQATSGFEIELKRIALREVRREQLVDYRPVEREIADVLSRVLINARHPMAYAMDGWSINFGELEAPTDPMATLDLWKRMEDLDLISREQMYMNLNPEAKPSEAALMIDENQKRRIERMRSIQRSNPGVFNLENNAASNDDDDDDASQLEAVA